MGIMKAWASGQIDCDDMKQGICLLPLMLLNRHSAAGFANTTYQERRRKDTERFGVFGLLRKHQVLMHGHIPATILLFLMVILLVAVGETFLSQLLTALAVDVGEPRATLRQGVVLEDICHVMEQPRHRKEYLRRCRSTLSFQKALRVAVPLLCRQGQPLDALLFVTLDYLSLN